MGSCEAICFAGMSEQERRLLLTDGSILSDVRLRHRFLNRVCILFCERVLYIDDSLFGYWENGGLVAIVKRRRGH